MWRVAFCSILVCVVFIQSGCRPPEDGRAVLKCGAISGNTLVTAYGIVRFSTGKYGLIVVARSKGDARVEPELAEEGVARIEIDDSTYSFPLSENDLSHDQVISYFDEALKQHAEIKGDGKTN